MTGSELGRQGREARMGQAGRSYAARACSQYGP
jgi:hypothetical protein